ncbi:MAG: YbbR-like domain-containing protein [Bacteroidales bacterium]
MNQGKWFSIPSINGSRHSERRLRKSLSVFSVCVLIAVFLWIVIKLSDSYSSEVKYHIHFRNQSSEVLIADISDSIVLLNVKAEGFKLLNIKWFSPLPELTIDIGQSDMEPLTGNSRYNYYILTEDLKSKIEGETFSLGELTEINPDTLYFLMDHKSTKKVAVKPMTDISFAPQYHFYQSIQVKPDSILISGAKPYLDTIEAIQTERFTASGVKEDISNQLSLKFPPGVESKTGKVNLKIEVEEYTEASVEVDVNTENKQNSDYILKTFPETVTITFWVALKDYQKVSSAQFSAAVDIESVDIGEDDKARVRVTRFPSYIKNLRINPRSVEYIIKQKDTDD